jgi:hypothetical protein
MIQPLAYYSPDDRHWRSPDAELSEEQQELNAGARRLYAVRRRGVARPALQLHPGHRPLRALPAAFAPRLLPPPPGWSA